MQRLRPENAFLKLQMVLSLLTKTPVGFETFKNRYIVGTPDFAIEQLINVRKLGVSNRGSLLDASTWNQVGR